MLASHTKKVLDVSIVDLASEPAYFVVDIPVQLNKDTLNIEATQVNANTILEPIC